MSERLEKIKNYYSSMESLHPDIQEDMSWLIDSLEELEEENNILNDFRIRAREQANSYKQWLEDIRDISTGSVHEFAVKALKGERDNE